MSDTRGKHPLFSKLTLFETTPTSESPTKETKEESNTQAFNLNKLQVTAITPMESDNDSPIVAIKTPIQKPTNSEEEEEKPIQLTKDLPIINCEANSPICAVNNEDIEASTNNNVDIATNFVEKPQRSPNHFKFTPRSLEANPITKKTPLNRKHSK